MFDRINFAAFEKAQNHIGNIDAEQYAKVVGALSEISVPKVPRKTYVNPWTMSTDPQDNLTLEEAIVMAMELNRTDPGPMQWVNGQLVPPGPPGAAYAPLANAQAANAQAVNAPAANVPVDNAQAANAQAANAQAVNAPAANAPAANAPVANAQPAYTLSSRGLLNIPVAVNFDTEAELDIDMPEQPENAPNDGLPMNFGDLIGAAHNKYMAAYTDARNGTGNAPKDFLTYVHECAVGNLEPSKSSAQQAIDEAAGLDRTIYRDPNSAYPTTTVPSMSFDNLVSRNDFRGPPRESRGSRLPRPLDINTVLANNRLELARFKEREVRKLRISIDKYRRDNGLDTDLMVDILSETPDSSTMPQQRASTPELQGYLNEQQMLVQVPEEQVEPMNGPDAMNDPSHDGPMRADTAWNLSTDVNDDESIEIAMQMFMRPRVSGPRQSAPVRTYVNEVSARHPSRRRVVDLVPANPPVEGDILLGRPRTEREIQRRRPNNSNDPWESESEIEFDSEVDEDDIDMADQ